MRPNPMRYTYPTLCLPVITGNIANHIGLLLQANIRKAGTVGTPSVPRTTVDGGDLSHSHEFWLRKRFELLKGFW